MKKILSIILVLSVLFICCSCNNPVTTDEQTQSDKPSEQIKTVDPISDNYRVFYEIFTGSFSDSNGDGIGDLKGITNRLDYLNDGDINSGNSLGIQGIWLTPIFSSTSYHKYDVDDYYSIDKDFGTEEDLKELVNEAHKRNVLVILDLPLNHTSSQNPWFARFVNAHKNNDTENQFYDFYSWCKKSEKPSGRSFTTIQGTADEMYEANFNGGMPELNFDNEKVREELVNVAKYYLNLGVDGFRIDAAKYVYYGETDKNVEFYDWYVSKLKEEKSDVYLVGEVWSNDIETTKYFTSLNCFNFQMAQAEGYIKNATAQGNVNIYTSYVESYLDTIKEKNEDAMLIPFISNHDLDRSAGYLTLASRRMNIAANLYILCQGSPFIYYGEEIGMKGVRGGSNTDANRRLAMLWGDGDTVNDPVGTTYEKSKQSNGTVVDHLSNEDSLLNYYKKLIAFRNKYPSIARGEYESLNLKDTKVGGFKISYEGNEYILIHNTQGIEQTLDMTSITGKTVKTIDFIGQGDASINDGKLNIGMQTSVFLVLE